MLDETLKGFSLHKAKNFCLTLPGGINPIKTKHVHSTRKWSYKWDEQLGPGWITVKMTELPLPQRLPLLGQQGQSQRLRISPPHTSREQLSFCFPARTWFLLSLREPEGLGSIQVCVPSERGQLKSNALCSARWGWGHPKG